LDGAFPESLRQEQATAEQFRLTLRTEQQRVQFYDYREVQANYRLNILLNFNHQPTALVLAKLRYTIQLHNLSVHIAI